MDLNYYKNFNSDLFFFTNNMLIKHYNNNKNEKRIINEETFYNAFPDFNYNIYNNINEDLKNKNYTKIELEKHFYFYGRFENRIYSKKTLLNAYPYSLNNIIIYPHVKYNEDDGGINVMYYLAKLLDEYGKNVRIYPTFGKINNSYFNKYYNNDFNIKNSIIIYCEGTKGNPLNGIYIIRWILSPIGLNVPKEFCLTWNDNELLYYFNYEKKFINNYNIKLLPIIILNNKFINKKYIRINEICYTYRKSNIHKNIVKIHNDSSYNILRNNNNDELIEIFNKYKYFYSYDPLTFMSVLAAKCGCISVVYKIDNVVKEDWLKMTSVYPYLKEKNEELYGIAYGLDDIDFAIKTLDKVNEQWINIINYNENIFFKNFINDLKNYDYGSGINLKKNFNYI